MVGNPGMSSQWNVIAESVIGYSHIRKKLPNQDQGAFKRKYGGSPLIGAVSDGHGGKMYFRSDRGSDFAVRSVISVLSYFYDQEPALSDGKITEAICRDILKEWKINVLEDITKNPYSADELQLINEGKAGRKFNIPIDPDYELIRPYGSTVLATIITQEYAFVFQLGDGDIIIHTQDGSFHRPIPSDKNLTGNETYSLCMPESWRDFKVQRIDDVPDFIMLCTDGYANSFIDDSGFISAARDLYSYIFKAESFEAGIESVRLHVGGWLSKASEKGSGDDITMLLFAQNPGEETKKPRKLSDDQIIVLNTVPLRPLSYDFLMPEEEAPPEEPDTTGPTIPDTAAWEFNQDPVQRPVIRDQGQKPVSPPPSVPLEPEIPRSRSVPPPPVKKSRKFSKKIVLVIICLLLIGIAVSLFVVFPVLDRDGKDKPVLNPTDSSTDGGETPDPGQGVVPHFPDEEHSYEGPNPTSTPESKMDISSNRQQEWNGDDIQPTTPVTQEPINPTPTPTITPTTTQGTLTPTPSPSPMSTPSPEPTT